MNMDREQMRRFAFYVMERVTNTGPRFFRDKETDLIREAADLYYDTEGGTCVAETRISPEGLPLAWNPTPNTGTRPVYLEVPVTQLGQELPAILNALGRIQRPQVSYVPGDELAMARDVIAHSSKEVGEIEGRLKSLFPTWFDGSLPHLLASDDEQQSPTEWPGGWKPGDRVTVVKGQHSGRVGDVIKWDPKWGTFPLGAVPVYFSHIPAIPYCWMQTDVLRLAVTKLPE